MYQTKFWQVKKKRECEEPGHKFLMKRSSFHGSQERLVLVSISVPISGGVMLTQVLTRTFRVRKEPGNSVELVVAHDRLGRSGINHASNQIDRFTLLRSTVDEIADE